MQEASSIPTKSCLSHAKVQLIELMQRINYGRIEGLSICNGEPVMDPPPRVVREIKFGGDNGLRPEVAQQDFALKVQVRELFARMEALGDATIHSIDVKHGLPFKMTVEDVYA